METTKDVGPSAPVLEMMEQGATVMRIENENLQAMAIQRPREIARLTNAAMDELRAFPQFAAKAYYSIPYKDRSTGIERTVMVEGPSIKSANALARHWGNNSSGFRIVGSDEERVTVQGVFIDHETGMRRTAEISVSRKAKSKKGEIYFLAVDRLNIAIQAGGSKAVRNAILNALPIGLVDGYFAEAKKIAARGGKLVESPAVDTKAIADQMEKCLFQLEQLGIERAEVADYINRHPELSDEETVVAHLIGLLNAVEEGAANLEDIFTVPEAKIAEPQRRSDMHAEAHGFDKPPVSPPPAQKVIPENARRMIAQMNAGTCGACGKGIQKGQAIFKVELRDKWSHEKC